MPAIAPDDVQRLSAEIGDTIKSIRHMIDTCGLEPGDALLPVIQQDAASFRAARFGDDPDIDRRLGDNPAAQWKVAKTPSVLTQMWQAWGAQMLARLQPVVPPAPLPVVDVPPPVAIPTCQEVAELVLTHPRLDQRLQALVQQELEGEMGAKFSANLRAVIRSQVAMAVQDQMIDA